MSHSDLQQIYEKRFQSTGLDKRQRVWKILCSDVFGKMIPPTSTVLDIACGYGEFINQISAARKFAIDLNPDSPRYLAPDVTFRATPANDLSFIPDGTLDVAFTSNFLEHLPDKKACDGVLAEVRRKLKSGGRFIILGPNIRFAYREYWDYYDHYLALSDQSLAEGLTLAGYNITEVIPQFLPYTMNNSAPTSDILIKAYLQMRFAWRIFGRQFLVTAQKP